jgi:hypothetical protein
LKEQEKKGIIPSKKTKARDTLPTKASHLLIIIYCPTIFLALAYLANCIIIDIIAIVAYSKGA